MSMYDLDRGNPISLLLDALATRKSPSIIIIMLFDILWLALSFLSIVSKSL